MSNITAEKPKELQHGQVIATTSGYKDWQFLEFPIDAFFDGLQNAKGVEDRPLSVVETLGACIDSVEMVVSRLRKEFI